MTASVESKHGLARAGVVSLGVVLSALVLALAFRDFVATRYRQRSIEVTGSATRRVRSDLALWRATLTARATTLDEAYREIARSTGAIRQFFTAQGAKPEEVRVEAVETEEVRAVFYVRDAQGEVLSEENRLTAYELTRTFVLTSSDIPKVERIAQGVTDLLQDGVTVRSSSVEYVFTRLAGLKVELIEAATRDARGRAERVARASGASLGDLVLGDVGVVQVNAANETETSWDGVNDRSSPDKDAMVTVRTVFTVD